MPLPLAFFLLQVYSLPFAFLCKEKRGWFAIFHTKQVHLLPPPTVNSHCIHWGNCQFPLYWLGELRLWDNEISETIPETIPVYLWLNWHLSPGLPDSGVITSQSLSPQKTWSITIHLIVFCVVCSTYKIQNPTPGYSYLQSVFLVTGKHLGQGPEKWLWRPHLTHKLPIMLFTADWFFISCPPGDILLNVNGIDLTGVSRGEAVALLKNTSSSVLLKVLEMKECETLEDGTSDSSLLDASSSAYSHGEWSPSWVMWLELPR